LWPRATISSRYFKLRGVIVIVLRYLKSSNYQVNYKRYRESTDHVACLQIGERTALLSSPTSSYIQFPEEQDPSYLGIAMEDATIASKLVFHWVTPLMEKGVKGLLNHPDDLFDLPDHIGTNVIARKIDRHLHSTVMHDDL